MFVDISTILFVCFAVGAIARTGVGFLSKIAEAPEGTLKFNAQYWATCAISIISTFFLAVAAFMSFPLPENVPLIYIVALGLSGGWTLNDLVNTGVSTYQNRAKPFSAPNAFVSSPANAASTTSGWLFRRFSRWLMDL